MPWFPVGCGGDGDRRAPAAGATWFSDLTAALEAGRAHDTSPGGDYFMPESIGAGGALLDYDGDGDLDVLVIQGPGGEGGGGQRLFRQEADGRLVEVTAAAGLGGAAEGMGVAVGDVDNDGDLDLYVSSHGPDRLYRNEGDGRFSDATARAGIDNPAWGCSAVFFDYDLDGYLDLFVTNYVAFDPGVVCADRAGRRDYCGPSGFPGIADVLYRNRGDGSFSDVSDAAGISAAAAPGLGVVAADFDADGLADVYVANDGAPNNLWMNLGGGRFEDRGVAAGAAVNYRGEPEAGMGVAVGDVDGDRHPDLFVTHLRHETNTLYRRVEAGFRDETVARGLANPGRALTGFGTGLADFDLDGDLDLAVVNGRVTRGPLLTPSSPPSFWDEYAEPNLLFENDGAGRFRDASARGGPYAVAVENSRGLAVGDLDGDGDPDLLVTGGGGPPRLYRNDVGDGASGLVVRVLDRPLLRDALGATVEAGVAETRLSRIVNPGYGFLSSSDPRVHLGLGDAAVLPQLDVEWPGGGRRRLRALPANRVITVGRGLAEGRKGAPR